MRAFFEKLNKKTRIKTLSELEPGFTPRWLRIYRRWGLVAFLAIGASIVTSGSDFWLARWLQPLVLLSVFSMFIFILLLEAGIPLAFAIGYFFPRIAERAAAIEKYFEKDLQWGPPK